MSLKDLRKIATDFFIVSILCISINCNADNTTKVGMSESEKEITLKYALKGLKGNYWNSMGPKRGFNLLKSLSIDGYAPAQVELGHIYKWGKKPINVVDIKQAFYWYSLAANQNNPIALNNLGTMYDEGLGVEKNPKKARQLYIQAANLGDEYANFNVGAKFDSEGKYEKAREYYLKAAAKNHPTAMYNIGTHYYFGKGVSKNIKEAVYWFERAAELNEPLAQNNLGWILARGENGDVDTKRAVKLFKKAASKGVKNAKESLDYIDKHGSLLK